MRSIEAGREVLKYIGKTAKEVAGIGIAQRIYKESMVTPEGVFDKKPSRASVLTCGVVSGINKVSMPLYSKTVEEDQEKANFGIAIDLAANFIVIALLVEAGVQTAFIGKLGYNTLLQIAPDVAKLAKDRVFQRAK